MNITATEEVSSLYLTLDDGRRVTLRSNGSVEIHRAKTEYRDYDCVRLDLPQVDDISEACSERDADTSSDGFPRFGTATITVTHDHG